MYDDELAALLALDALEPDDEADAELSPGTWPMSMADATLPLAETVSEEPPEDLRAQVLEAAFARRRPGGPTPSPQAVTPPEAFALTIDDFHRLLRSLSDAEAELTAHEEHGRVRDLVAHLLGIERLIARWLDPDAVVAPLPDHVAATRDTVAAMADAPFTDVVGQWHEAALAVLDAARGDDGTRRMPFHDLEVSIDGMLTMRTFELWAHGMDIALVTGRPLPELEPARLKLMSSRLMEALPGALAYRGASVGDRTVRFVLTGPAGGCYDVAFATEPVTGGAADPEVTIVADVTDLCRVAAARLSPDDLRRTVEGDPALAELVLANIDAFARD
jgi:uncharacterized protein (TIGR03083 family)